MPSTLERPVFVEDQVLTPDDLNDLLGYGRTQLARHVRSAHTWGIVEGLMLTLQSPDWLLIAAGWATAQGADLLREDREQQVQGRCNRDGSSPGHTPALRGSCRRRGARPATDTDLASARPGPGRHADARVRPDQDGRQGVSPRLR